MKTRTLGLLGAVSLLLCFLSMLMSHRQSICAATANAEDDRRASSAQSHNEVNAAPAADGRPPEDAPDLPRRIASDRYGDPLPQSATARLGTIRLRHRTDIRAVAFSPDGLTLASAGDDGIRLWNPSSGEPHRQRFGRYAGGIAFSPDGSKLATIAGKSVHLWDTDTGEEIWNARDLSFSTRAVLFLPDGSAFVTSFSDGTLRFWDVANGRTERVLRPPGGPARHALAVSPDGSLLACGAAEHIYVYDLNVGVWLPAIQRAHTHNIDSLAFSPNGKQLASAGSPSIGAAAEPVAEVRLWTIEDGTLLREFSAEEKDLWNCNLGFSPDGRVLVSQHVDKIRIWNAESGALLRTIREYGNYEGASMQGLAVTPDHNRIATVGPHCEVTLWNLETGQRHLHFAESHAGPLRSVACSPNGKVIASGGEDGSIHLWDAMAGNMMHVMPLCERDSSNEPWRPPFPVEIDEHWPVLQVTAFSPDGSVVASTGARERLWGIGGIATLTKLDGTSVWTHALKGRGTALAFSKDGQVIAIAHGGGPQLVPEYVPEPSVTIYSARSGESQQQIIGLKNRVVAMNFSADGSTLQIVDERSISTWDTASGEKQELLAMSPHHREIIRAAAFAPAGNMIATSGNHDDLIIFWDPTNGEELRRLRAVDTSSGSTLAFSNDGVLLATASGYSGSIVEHDKDIHIWNASSGERVARFSAGITATSLAFMPGDTQLASAMDDGTVLIWDASQVGR